MGCHGWSTKDAEEDHLRDGTQCTVDRGSLLDLAISSSTNISPLLIANCNCLWVVFLLSS